MLAIPLAVHKRRHIPKLAGKKTLTPRLLRRSITICDANPNKKNGNNGLYIKAMETENYAIANKECENPLCGCGKQMTYNTAKSNKPMFSHILSAGGKSVKILNPIILSARNKQAVVKKAIICPLSASFL